MRVIKTKENSLFIETNRNPEIVEDRDGTKIYYIHLPPIQEIFRLMPTPLLEDIFAEARMELMERDRGSILEAI